MEDYPLVYPRLAACINADVNFRVYRRFGTLRNRVILHRQQELAKLESQLNELDAEDSRNYKHRITSIRRDKEDPESRRQPLIDEIDRKIVHYGIYKLL